MNLIVLRPHIRFEKKWPDILAGILQAIVFVLGGMLLARWIWLFFAPAVPVLPLKQEQAISSHLATIVSGHWFGVASDRVVAIVPATVNFKLTGVYAPTGSKQGFAIFKLADGKQRSVLLHEEITPGIRLQSIQQDAVQVGQEGSTQKLTVENRTSKATVPAATVLQFKPPL